jgi:hypothetical protein
MAVTMGDTHAGTSLIDRDFSCTNRQTSTAHRRLSLRFAIGEFEMCTRVARKVPTALPWHKNCSLLHIGVVKRDVGPY